jgi:hypothetical protein
MKTQKDLVTQWWHLKTFVSLIQKQVVNKRIGPNQKEQHAMHYLLESQVSSLYIMVSSVLKVINLTSLTSEYRGTAYIVRTLVTKCCTIDLEMFDLLEDYEFPLHRIHPHMYVYSALLEHNVEFCTILSHLHTVCERSGRCGPCPLFNVYVHIYVLMHHSSTVLHKI